MKRHAFNPKRIRPRTASERRHRELVAFRLKQLRRCIKEDRQGRAQ